MKKLITERLGVPKGIYQTAVSIYEELIRNLIDVLDESETEYDLEFDLIPPAQVEDIIFNKIKFNVEITETDKVDSPKILGWKHFSEINVDTGNEKPNLVYKQPFGEISLGLDLAVPENWNVEDLKIFLFENYRESISAIAHEVKHFYDENRAKKANLRKLVNYQASKKLIGSKIEPLRQLAFDLYYISNIESTVRPTEIATKMMLQDIDKRKFYNFLTSTETYQHLKRISQFSKEKLRSDLYNYIDEIKEIFEQIGRDLGDYQNDDELVDAMIDLWINTFKKRNVEIFTELLSTDPIDYFVGLRGKKEEWRKKFIKSKLDKIMSDPDKFLDKTENLFKFVSTKMMKKIAKLYDYIGEQPMKESIVDPELYGMFKNGNIFENSFVTKDGKLGDFEKIFYDFDEVRKFVEWFRENNRNEARKQGWDIFETHTSEPNEKYFSLRQIDGNPVEGHYYVVKRIKNTTEGETSSRRLKNDDEAKQLAEKMKIMVDEYGVIYGFKGWEFFPIQ